jgi:protein-L-isoaspartate(D-aspartate) O-methyltransferase
MSDHAVARRNMIESQLKPNRVTDERVIGVMATLPREIFVSQSLKGVAYVDEDVEVAPGRYLMEPAIFARMVQEAKIGSKDIVLEIGCGAGYSTAVLARLAASVIAVESDPALARTATQNLAAAGIDNAAVIDGALAEGYSRRAPYQIVFVNGAVSKVPARLLDQVAEGGRLIAVERDVGRSQVVLYSRSGGLIGHRALFDANVPIVPGFEAATGFIF